MNKFLLIITILLFVSGCGDDTNENVEFSCLDLCEYSKSDLLGHFESPCEESVWLQDLNCQECENLFIELYGRTHEPVDDNSPFPCTEDGNFNSDFFTYDN